MSHHNENSNSALPLLVVFLAFLSALFYLANYFEEEIFMSMSSTATSPNTDARNTIQEEIDNAIDAQSSWLDLSGTSDPVDDAIIASWGRLTGIESLSLSSSEVTDLAMDAIGKLTSLKRLDLNNTAVTDEGMQSLHSLSALESLSLRNTQLRTLRWLTNLPSLSHLDIQGVAVADHSFDEIKHLKHLEDLNLAGTAVTDDEIGSLADLRSLEFMNIANTEVTIDGLRPLAGAASLKRMFLVGSKVYVRSQEDAEVLLNVKNLDLITMNHDQITPAMHDYLEDRTSHRVHVVYEAR